ncbi:MAG: hypothetical protein K1X88_28200 [Nannocystaceae bacterium]|nr:hypothetical protein [Nannocystaceae bacterium]
MTQPTATRTLSSLAALAVAALALGACKKTDTDHPDVASKYRNSKYHQDIVSGDYTGKHEHQGDAIQPATLRAIEDTIHTSYEKDFERCLEDEMDTADTRFMRSVFSVEFKIDTKGNAGEAKVLDIWLKKQNAKGTDIGEVPTDGMEKCIVAAIDEWVFDPAPEVDYLHTYKGQVGEAF